MAVAIGNGGTQRPQRPQRCSSGGGPKFKLIHEGDIQVCRLNHSRTLISKVLSSKFLRRWEAHHIYLGDFQLYSSSVRVKLSGSIFAHIFSRMVPWCPPFSYFMSELVITFSVCLCYERVQSQHRNRNVSWTNIYKYTRIPHRSEKPLPFVSLLSMSNTERSLGLGT